jgi:hypothetical protein
MFFSVLLIVGTVGTFAVVSTHHSEELDGPAVNALSVLSRKLSNLRHSSDEWPKIYYQELIRASEGT